MKTIHVGYENGLLKATLHVTLPDTTQATLLELQLNAFLMISIL